MKKFLFILMLAATVVCGQKLKGIVYEELQQGNLEPLPGVNIFWAGTQLGTSSDEKGLFTLLKPAGETAKLVVTYVTYKPDTIVVKKEEETIEIVLKENRELDEVVVSAKTKGVQLLDVEAIQTHQINRKELTRAACCNLSESFETNASVDVSYSDAVTGAKQIKLLGLHGKYSQLMLENIPHLRGLAQAFGIYYIPGPWMESIQISKGTASVINGFESITGQINVEYKKPISSERFYAELYQSDNLKNDLNTNTYYKVSDNLSTILLLHGEYQDHEQDESNNGFQDHPNIKQFNVVNRWTYMDGKHWHVEAGVNLLSEERWGGQNTVVPRYNTTPYKTEIKTQRMQAWSKTGYIFDGHSHTSIGWQNTFSNHKQDSYFGLRTYNAKQLSYYSNFILETKALGEDHKISTGVSFVYDEYDESLSGTDLDRSHTIPGAFLEYTFLPFEGFSVIGGIRADNHSEEGTFYTPRIHMRYSPLPNTILRLSGGKGYRNANVVSENINLLSSSRNFVIANDLQMEEAWNMGFNLTQYFYIMDKELSVNIDYYRTEFVNKVVTDIDQSSHEVNFYNLEGDAYTDIYQVEVAYELFSRLDVLTAARYSNSKTTYNGKLLDDPLNKNFKGLVSLSYLTKLRLWQFDLTAQFNGKSRLPGFSDNPNLNVRKESPAFTIFNAQITRYYEQFQIYLGAENLGGFTQDTPVISPENPFGPDFDASVVWGPVMGRHFYAGIRYSLK